jgi:hypothetical protein
MREARGGVLFDKTGSCFVRISPVRAASCRPHPGDRMHRARAATPAAMLIPTPARTAPESKWASGPFATGKRGWLEIRYVSP